ncbi:MAG: RidA family protein [Actinobacteria bacterium]|nr:RidA family protein [Actinomycetota bacterium]
MIEGGSPPAPLFSSSIRAGDLIFTAGVVPRNPDRSVRGVTVAEQTVATFDNLRRVLGAHDATLADVVKLQVYLADLAAVSEFNVAYLEQLGDHRPPRTTVGAALNGVLVEIDAVAYRPL